MKNGSRLKALIIEALLEAACTNRPLTEGQAAKVLGISSGALREERKRGRIKPYRIVRNRIRYTTDLLVEYCKNHPLNAVAQAQLDEHLKQRARIERRLRKPS